MTRIFILTLFLLFVAMQINVFAQTSTNELVPKIEDAAELIRDKQWSSAVTTLEKITKHEPGNKKAWGWLGLAYHSLAKYSKALAAYERSIAISKDPTTAYNMACSYSLIENKDKAIEWLDAAINLGFNQTNLIKTDADLVNIRNDARFGAILEKMERAANPCMHTAENRQFDFWVGDWEVLVQNQKVGENLVEIETKGCTVVENWKGTGGNYGKSINVFNPDTRKWKQFYVGSGGKVLELVGEYKNEVMRLEGETVGPGGAKVLNILSFHNLANKTVRQQWEISTDGGKTWQTSWDAIYVRKPK